MPPPSLLVVCRAIAPIELTLSLPGIHLAFIQVSEYRRAQAQP